MSDHIIELEDVVSRPPGWSFPDSIQFSPDNKRVSYLMSEDRSLTRQLYSFEVETGSSALLIKQSGNDSEEGLSLEEQLRRERLRVSELGITQYSWSSVEDTIIVPLRGGIYVQKGADAQLMHVYKGSDAQDPKLSPDGKLIAFVRGGEVFVMDIDGDDIRQITSGCSESGKTNGLADYLAQEEMNRLDGFWWSPDSKKIAFEQVDEQHIPIFKIVHQGKDDVQTEDHRYPFAGEANPIVKLGVVPITEPFDVTWMDLGQEQDIYLARVNWLPDGTLTAQVQDRQQKTLELHKFDPNGSSTLILKEESDTWINLNDLFRTISVGKYSNHFVWGSERSGYQHLYLYKNDGTLIKQITNGEWMVDEICGLDARSNVIYFTSTQQDVREKHFYSIQLDETNSEPIRITTESGWHNIVLDHSCDYYTDTFSNISTPPRVTLHSIKRAVTKTIFDQLDPKIHSIPLVTPEFISFENKSGITLHGAIFKPNHIKKSLPTIVYVYGGPHVQLVQNTWRFTINMRAQRLCSMGFLLFVMDNSGSSRRGLHFEKQIYRRMGNVEVQDQAEGIQHLIKRGLTDPSRVGIYGWSYGGYMSLMALAKAPETFKVAVSGAPVTHWDGYDTHYTERYMGTPKENQEGYKDGSVMQHVGNMKGKLMLVHGMIDENVHFRHTARLIKALNRERKPYDLFLLPDDRHRPRSESDMLYMEDRIANYFVENLQ
ncbi:dipeptidyl aminopeptidase [Acrasis kona]|uniref:Dipeptidyl aminopeptidase n=1 Tax=Acrasis kona TaxID=1008807 RepID=A0AAW2YSF8_9EUKA